MIRRWPELRAGLIAMAIAIGLVDGCPLPPPGYVKPWQAPVVDLVRPVQRAVLTPFRWINHGLQFSQRWSLFQVAARERFRLEIEGRAQGGPWEVLYRAGDADHAAYAELLHHDRVRGAWDPTDRPSPQYRSFAPWLMDRILVDRPALQAVRMRFEKIVIERGEVRGTGIHVYELTTTRSPR
jgi:hypothetical protein